MVHPAMESQPEIPTLGRGDQIASRRVPQMRTRSTQDLTSRLSRIPYIFISEYFWSITGRIEAIWYTRQTSDEVD